MDVITLAAGMFVGVTLFSASRWIGEEIHMGMHRVDQRAREELERKHEMDILHHKIAHERELVERKIVMLEKVVDKIAPMDETAIEATKEAARIVGLDVEVA